MPRWCVWGPSSPQTSAHEDQVHSHKMAEGGLQAQQPARLVSIAGSQAISIKRNDLCWPRIVQLSLASSENFSWQGGGRPWGQDSCPGAGGIPMCVWRWALKHSPGWSDIVVLLSTQRNKISFTAWRMKPSPRGVACLVPIGPLRRAAGAKTSDQRDQGEQQCSRGGGRSLHLVWRKEFLRLLSWLLGAHRHVNHFFLFFYFVSELKAALKAAPSCCIFLQLKCCWRHHHVKWNVKSWSAKASLFPTEPSDCFLAYLVAL